VQGLESARMGCAGVLREIDGLFFLDPTAFVVGLSSASSMPESALSSLGSSWIEFKPECFTIISMASGVSRLLTPRFHSKALACLPLSTNKSLAQSNSPIYGGLLASGRGVSKATSNLFQYLTVLALLSCLAQSR